MVHNIFFPLYVYVRVCVLRGRLSYKLSLLSAYPKCSHKLPLLFYHYLCFFYHFILYLYVLMSFMKSVEWTLNLIELNMQWIHLST